MYQPNHPLVEARTRGQMLMMALRGYCRKDKWSQVGGVQNKKKTSTYPRVGVGGPIGDGGAAAIVERGRGREGGVDGLKRRWARREFLLHHVKNVVGYFCECQTKSGQAVSRNLNRTPLTLFRNDVSLTELNGGFLPEVSEMKSSQSKLFKTVSRGAPQTSWPRLA